MPNPKLPPPTSDLPVTVLPVDDLKPYPRNPRHITTAAVNAVAESLSTFGWQQPIVIDPKGVIVAGHKRRLAALQLGLTHAPTVSIEAKHAAAYRLADNRSGEFSTWDLDLLSGELAALPGGQLEALPALDLEGLIPAVVISPAASEADFAESDSITGNRRVVYADEVVLVSLFLDREAHGRYVAMAEESGVRLDEWIMEELDRAHPHTDSA